MQFTLSDLFLITGAAGLLGSQLVEQIQLHGHRVRAFVRPSSDTRRLQQLGVELCSGDLEDIATIRRAVQGVTKVFHCAAHVGDWGSWQEFYQGNVIATENLVQACREADEPRLVHVSSISVYGNFHPTGSLGRENMPLGENHWLWDHYGRSKVWGENVVRQYPNHVILRPSWVYGPGDRNAIPRIVGALRQGRVRWIGNGKNLLNMVFVGDVARGALLAGTKDEALGKAYHLCSPGELNQREVLHLLCEMLDLPPVRRAVPLSLAWQAAFVLEAVYRLCRSKHPPPITRRAIYMVGRTTHFSIEAAKRDLGWEPEIGLQKGLAQTFDWYRQAGLLELD